MRYQLRYIRTLPGALPAPCCEENISRRCWCTQIAWLRHEMNYNDAIRRVSERRLRAPWGSSEPPGRVGGGRSRLPRWRMSVCAGLCRRDQPVFHTGCGRASFLLVPPQATRLRTVPWLSGRASASHAEGRWFDPSRDHNKKPPVRRRLFCVYPGLIFGLVGPAWALRIVAVCGQLLTTLTGLGIGTESCDRAVSSRPAAKRKLGDNSRPLA